MESAQSQMMQMAVLLPAKRKAAKLKRVKWGTEHYCGAHRDVLVAPEVVLELPYWQIDDIYVIMDIIVNYE